MPQATKFLFGVEENAFTCYVVGGAMQQMFVIALHSWTPLENNYQNFFPALMD